MNTVERIKMIKAMEYIVRQVNNEMLFDNWLTIGVADGDISYGDLSVGNEDAEKLEWYCDTESFADIMDSFLRLMQDAYHDGGLCCDGVVSQSI